MSFWTLSIGSSRDNVLFNSFQFSISVFVLVKLSAVEVKTEMAPVRCGSKEDNTNDVPKEVNKVTVVLGAQWGDEGKGKVVDMLALEADIVCRCQVSYYFYDTCDHAKNIAMKVMFFNLN